MRKLNNLSSIPSHVFSDLTYTFACDFHNIHEHIRKQLDLNNAKYTEKNNNKFFKEYDVSDHVLICIQH